MLQNANPCGGLVIGAFNIVGSVLENDLDMFRSLKADEMYWPEGLKKPAPDQNDQKLWPLGIEWSVAPEDVEEYDKTVEYVSYRWSDGQLQVRPNVVTVSLVAPLAFDIVSFAPLYYVSKEDWIACVGAAKMMNSGGAVLDLQVHNNIVSVNLLGEGQYLFVCSTGVTISVKSVHALGEDKDITLQNAFLSMHSAVEGESFKTADLLAAPA